MDELAGFGIPSWLPPHVQRSQLRMDAREARVDAQEAHEREALAEERHQRALTLYREQAEARGEVVNVMDLAAGRVRGRPVRDVFAAAVAAAEADDRREAARMHREGHGEPERLHVDVGEPVLHTAPKSERARLMSNRFRRWNEARTAQRRAEAAEEASRYDWGLVPGVSVRSRD